ncbi:hypothetical protein BGW80DRAFT_1461423 [Lactifluus volemus]|nr:hypothetical protein BGW80DRAFT_1461423 [Lactifluus volemus]
MSLSFSPIYSSQSQVPLITTIPSLTSVHLTLVVSAPDTALRLSKLDLVAFVFVHGDSYITFPLNAINIDIHADLPSISSSWDSSVVDRPPLVYPPRTSGITAFDVKDYQDLISANDTTSLRCPYVGSTSPCRIVVTHGSPVVRDLSSSLCILRFLTSPSLRAVTCQSGIDRIHAILDSHFDFYADSTPRSPPTPYCMFRTDISDSVRKDRIYIHP